MTRRLTENDEKSLFVR
uniref:Uncharacterized protein n=1 Tax=Parastrongyloides trichosuri TaxID=131310 RepID=A0A0N4ZCW4_PARTI